MSSDKVLKGAVAGAGVALLLMYYFKKKKKSTSKSAKAVSGDVTALKDMSDESLAELKDNVEDILAERGV